MTRPLRVLALMEAAVVTGPAKNLIEFAVRGAQPEAGGMPVDLALVTYQRGDVPANAFITAARAAGIRVYVLRERRRFDLRPLDQLQAAIEDFVPDIIQSHNSKSHFFVRLLGLYGKYPWIAFHHGYTTTDWKDRLYNQVDRWSLRKAHTVVAVCGAFARMLAGRGVPSDRLRIRHNSVKPFLPPAPEAVEQVRRQFNLAQHGVILSVGRLSLEKGHAGLLHSVALLAKRGKMNGWRLVIVGDGPERGRLEKLSVELGIAEVITFAGHQTDVRPFYSVAALLALPSHSEGSPNVVLESMAAGVPVAAAAVGGVPEIVDQDRTGLLAPAGDVSAMAGAMERLMNDEALRHRLRDAARSQVAASYTPEAYSRAVGALYEELLAGGGS